MCHDFVEQFDLAVEDSLPRISMAFTRPTLEVEWFLHALCSVQPARRAWFTTIVTFAIAVSCDWLLQVAAKLQAAKVQRKALEKLVYGVTKQGF